MYVCCHSTPWHRQVDSVCTRFQLITEQGRDGALWSPMYFEGIPPTGPEIFRNQYWYKIKMALFQTKYVMIPITSNFSTHECRVALMQSTYCAAITGYGVAAAQKFASVRNSPEHHLLVRVSCCLYDAKCRVPT